MSKTELFIAIDFGDTVEIIRILNNDPTSFETKYNNVTPISYAVLIQNERVIKTLIENGGAKMMQQQTLREAPLYIFLFRSCNGINYMYIPFRESWIQIFILLVNNTESMETLHLCKNELKMFIEMEEMDKENTVNMLQSAYAQSIDNAQCIKTLIEEKYILCESKSI
jgi:hypothetical protein